jgi:hypothetical protein
MSDRRTRQALDEVASYAKTEIEENKERIVDPVFVFNTLMDIGAAGDVQSKEETQVFADTRREILSRGGLPTAYGFDSANFPRSYDFIGGASMNIANAVIGRRNGNRELTKHRSIVAAMYTDTEEPVYDTSTVTDKTYESKGISSNVLADVVRLPEPTEGDIGSWVNTACLKFSLGKHLNRYIDEMEGGVFLDGPLYPVGVIHNSVYPLANEEKVDSEIVDAYRDILSNYAQAIERQIMSGYPIFGIVKTFRTSELVDSMYEKTCLDTDESEDIQRIPWKDDYSFVSDLLHDDEYEDHFTHTSWLVRPHPRSLNDDMVFPFKDVGLDYLNPHSDLSRAFFYVRLPEDGVVFRVEAPICLIRDDEDKQAIKQYALWEIANTKKVPQPIQNADADAALPRDLRDDLVEKMGGATGQQQDYNKDRRWPSLDYTGDTNE